MKVSRSLACLGMLLVALLLLTPLVAAKNECKNVQNRKRTLKLIKESSFFGLFRDLRGHTKFEGSDVIRVRGKFYVVFDSSFAVGALDDRFQFRDSANQLIGGSLGLMGESQFEGISWVPENDTFLLMQEAMRMPSGHYHPYIYQVRVMENGTDYEVLEKCIVHIEFQDDSKGLEGMQYLVNQHGAFLLGLCEGNHCGSGARGRQPGNGRIVAFQKNEADGACSWEPVKTIEIPKRAFFQDYSAMALNYYTGKMAILSQENSTMWLGDFDMNRLEFTNKGKVAYLPRNHRCEMIYCNAEGIQWIDNERVLIVSDKSKIRKQPYVCDEHDQSAHIFSLPGSMFEPSALWEDDEEVHAAEL